MGNPARDVCVICALPEEARAFLEVVERHCNVTFEKLTDTHRQYDYRLATLKNDKDEPLTIHVSWLPRYGPLEMTLHLSHVLDECQPRIAIMTGICAGDVQQVQLGDLVVAERTFTYDNGKFILDDEGRVVHQRDTMTYQLNAVSANFLASDFIACYELPRLLSRAEDGGTLILPIILSPCLFHETDLKVFQAVNSPYKSLAAMKFADREQIWVQVAEIIKKRRTLNSM